MIHLDIEQGTEAWQNARLGIPTASGFDKILTPKKLEYSAKAVDYRNQLVAEWILGHPIEWESNAYMDRGTGMEHEARAYYELQRGVDVVNGGFVLRDDGKVGGSPDGLVGDDGVLEIKCPAIHTHIGYLLEPSALSDKYRAQVQGYLYLTDRNWTDIISYNPVLPAVQVRISRDPKYIMALDAALVMFLADLDDVKEKLLEHKQEPSRPLQVVA